jgi:hypothetical protein
LKKGAEFTNGLLGLKEFRADFLALRKIDGSLTPAGTVGKVPYHAFRGAHTDIEIDAYRRPLATRIILATLTAAMDMNRNTIKGQIKERTIRNGPDWRDYAWIVYVIIFYCRGINRAWGPTGKHLIPGIVRRKVSFEYLPYLQKLTSDRRVDVLPFWMVWVRRGMHGIKSGVARGARYSDEW